MGDQVPPEGSASTAGTSQGTVPRTPPVAVVPPVKRPALDEKVDMKVGLGFQDKFVTYVRNLSAVIPTPFLTLKEHPEVFYSDSEHSSVDSMDLDSEVIASGPRRSKSKKSPQCPDGIECENDKHNKAGLKKVKLDPYTKHNEIHILCHILVMLLCANVSEGRLSCAECTPQVVGTYYVMLNHVKRVHGHNLGCRHDREERKERINAQRLRNLQRNKANLLLCPNCHNEFSGPYDLLYHFYSAHPQEASKGIPVCPECFLPLLDTNFSIHWAQTHSGGCRYCDLNTNDLTISLNHVLKKHSMQLIGTLDRDTLQAMHNNAKLHTVILPWQNQFRLLADTLWSNPLLPPLYSPQFFHMIRNMACNDNSIYKNLVPYQDFQQSRRRIAGESGPMPPQKSDSLLVYLELQKGLNEMLVRDAQNTKITTGSVFAREIDRSTMIICSFCFDDTPHHDSLEDCNRYIRTGSRLQDFLNFQIPDEEMKSYAAILVGKDCYNRFPLNAVFPVLNLSTNWDTAYPTGMVEAHPVIYNSQGPHSNVGTNLFSILHKIIQMRIGYARASTTLILLEFHLAKEVNPDDREEIFCQVVAFMSEVKMIRENYRIEIVILPPIGQHVLGGTAKDYTVSAAQATLITNIVTMVCLKLHIPVAPLHSQVGSHPYQNQDSAPHALLATHNSEPIFYEKGGFTSEYTHRLGMFTDKIINIWCQVIKRVSSLRTQYTFDLRDGGYEFPKKLVPIGLNFRQDTPGEDTV